MIRAPCQDPIPATSRDRAGGINALPEASAHSFPARVPIGWTQNPEDRGIH